MFVVFVLILGLRTGESLGFQGGGLWGLGV